MGENVVFKHSFDGLRIGRLAGLYPRQIHYLVAGSNRATCMMRERHGWTLLTGLRYLYSCLIRLQSVGFFVFITKTAGHIWKGLNSPLSRSSYICSVWVSAWVAIHLQTMEPTTAALQALRGRLRLIEQFCSQSAPRTPVWRMTLGIPAPLGND